MSTISADLYGDGRDDLALFYLEKEQLKTLIIVIAIRQSLFHGTTIRIKKLSKVYWLTQMLLLHKKEKKVLTQ